MPDIALYYPNTHIRDDAWLKAAALYWPKLAVIAVPEYPRRLSRTAQVLQDELAFVVDVDPSPQIRHVAEAFLDFVRREGDGLSRRYAYLRELPSHLIGDPGSPAAWEHGTEGRKEIVWSPLGNYPPAARVDAGPVAWINLGRVAWVHMFRMFSGLALELIDRGLAVLSADRDWLGMDPRLADVYLTALAERLAVANHMPAVTDRPRGHGVISGWDMETLARVLLAVDDDEQRASHEPADVAALYAAVAINTVVPRGLEDVRAEQVVRARRVLAAEFDAFRAHLDSLTDQFTEMAQIESFEVLRARLEVLVERDLRTPTADLERGLRQLGMEPTRAVLSLKSLELPAVAGAAMSGIGAAPVVGQAGLVAGQVIASSMEAHRAAQQRRRSAAGYLLGLREELDPQGVLDRLRRTFRRAGRTVQRRAR